MAERRAARVAASVLVLLGTPMVRGANPLQPAIVAREKPVLTLEGLRFKDSNGNGRLDPYEDWRRPVAARVADLVARMTLDAQKQSIDNEPDVPGYPVKDTLYAYGFGASY